jgi:hypothetical protein
MSIYSSKYYENLFNKFTEDEVNILNELFKYEINNADVVINYNIPTPVSLLYFENQPQIPPRNLNYMNYSIKELNEIIRNITQQYNYKIAASKSKYRAIDKLRYLDYHPAYLKEKLILDKQYNLSDIKRMPNKFLEYIAKQFNITWYINNKKTTYNNNKLKKELITKNLVIDDIIDTQIDPFYINYHTDDYTDDYTDDGIDYGIYENISD